MSPRTRTQQNLARVLSIVCVLGLLLSLGTWWLLRATAGTGITAYFEGTVGLYPGSKVRVVGIEVGSVTDVHPVGGKVRVRMSVEDGVTVPKDVKAVIIAPSLVSDRYVQLTPAYTAGPRMTSGAVIPEGRTATPVEIDDIYRSLKTLSSALGPHGANKDGALSRLLDTAAANLEGNGKNLNRAITDLGKAAATLSHSKGDLFDTVDNLATFTHALARSDSQVRKFEGRLADVSGFLAGDRQELGEALHALGGALGKVKKFVDTNADSIESNVGKLTDVTKVLVKQRGALAELLDVAPLGISNYVNAYDEASGSVATRGVLNELSYPPVMTLCRLINVGTPKGVPKTLGNTCKKLAPVLDGTLKLPSVLEVIGALQRGELPNFPGPVDDLVNSNGGLVRAPGGGK